MSVFGYPSEMLIRQKIHDQIIDHADKLRDSDDYGISRDERDAYYDAANIALTGETYL